MWLNSKILIIVLVFLTACSGATQKKQPNPSVDNKLPKTIDLEKIKQQKQAEYICYLAIGPIQTDGKLDDPSWENAPWSDPLVDIITGEKALMETRVKLLWDDQYLYIGYKNEEPYVCATLTERDSYIWNDNDIELFIAGKNAYYEFEMNALNTIYEVLWIWDDVLGKPGSGYPLSEWNPQQRDTKKLSHFLPNIHPRGERTGYFDYDLQGLKHAVYIDGTINEGKDIDNGWSVELALPWEALSLLSDGRPVPPENGDIWRIDCSRFQHFDKNGAKLDKDAGWTWNKHGYMNSHIPETFTEVNFSTVEVQ